MLYLNSALNPLLYNLISSKFRNAFVQTLCCQNLSKTNRMLVRQSTFNTTTTTMSLTGNSVLNGFLNNSTSNNRLNNDTNRYKRNSMQSCSLKQSYSVDTSLSTNLRQLNYKVKGRQASLQQFSSSASSSLFTKDENDNKINCKNELDEDRLSIGKRLKKQTSFIQNDDCEIEECDNQINQIKINNLSDKRSEDEKEENKPNSNQHYKSRNTNVNRQACQSVEIASNVNKKHYKVNCELKVSTLEDDLNSTNSSIKLDGKQKRKKFNFKFYQRISNRLFNRDKQKLINCQNKRGSVKRNDRETVNESIIGDNEISRQSRLSNNEASKESNV